MNSSSDHFCGCSTKPSTSNDQVTRSISGVPCASSTGHFRVRVWPGGIRFGSCVFGLMMSASAISSGWRGSPGWYFGSLNKPPRKLITPPRSLLNEVLNNQPLRNFLSIFLSRRETDLPRCFDCFSINAIRKPTPESDFRYLSRATKDRGQYYLFVKVLSAFLGAKVRLRLAKYPEFFINFAAFVNRILTLFVNGNLARLLGRSSCVWKQCDYEKG